MKVEAGGSGKRESIGDLMTDAINNDRISSLVHIITYLVSELTVSGDDPKSLLTSLESIVYVTIAI